MACPRCGCEDVPAETCPRCGIVVRKYQTGRSGRPVPSPRAPAHGTPRPVPATSGTSRGATWLLAAGVLAVAGVSAWVLVPGLRPRSAPAGDASLAAAPQALPAALDPSAEPPALDFTGGAPAAPADASAPAAAEGLSDEDAAALEGIVLRLPDGALPADAVRLEQLHERHPGSTGVRDALVSTLLALAKADLDARRFGDARARLERAAALAPADARPYIGLHRLYASELNWSAAEGAIRAALERDPGNAAARRALAWALFRQDRNKEAREVLLPLVESGDAEARDLLARIDDGLRDEAGMTEKRLSHFHVRYDGEEHTTVGHEILRALERHYGALKVTFGFEPQTVVPVILFSRQSYYDAAGAPAWSGGAFDQLDGRIRIPIGGLTPALTPDIDDTLVHELVHAFIHDRTRGAAPRDVHEGLAQFMEGKRTDELLDQETRAALARGQIGGVAGVYLEALAFVEYLMAQRGQGGINDLLRLMGETGSVDRAFDEVYGRGYDGTRKAWRERFFRETL